MRMIEMFDPDISDPSGILSVSSLTELIGQKLETEPMFRSLMVRGEISNFTAHSSGHFYFTLKDETAEINCIMFSSNAKMVRFTPERGMSIIASGRLKVYGKRGIYQLSVQSMEPDGIGNLYTAYRQLVERLRKEGLFETDRKRPCPRYPTTVGVVTSLKAAALRDILNVFARRWPVATIIVSPAYVQGSGAASTICEALKRLEHLPILTGGQGVDVAIVARGGGSIEDLWPFNEECVARAIRAAPFPVVSGVGHETDTTISDLVADLRAPTPSAAAELVAPSSEELFQELGGLVERSQIAMGTLLSNYMDLLGNQTRLLESCSPEGRIKLRREMLEKHTVALDRTMNDHLWTLDNELDTLTQRLNDLAPEKVLHRGYAIIMRQDRVVSSAGVLLKDDRVELLFADGRARAAIEDVEKNE